MAPAAPAPNPSTASAAPITREAELHWLALRLVPGLGARKSVQLLETFRSPLAIFRASVSELEAAGLSGTIARSIASGCTFDDAADQHQRILDSGVTLLPLHDPRYPALLRDIFDPPLLLFARGRIELLDRVQIGVVGTRRPTPYGVAVAERLANDLALAGFVVISGMARGIDTAAHRAVLAADGDTIAVFGCGVDLVYPAENRKLAVDMANRGLILSEFPMGSPAYPQNFPVRNRIIAGSSVGVLVVEGAQYSGSSITAKLAMEAGKEVFAVPGNITSKMSWGPNLLIKQGARLVQDWTDVLAELPAEIRRRVAAQGSLDLQEKAAAEQQAEPGLPMTALETTLLAKLRVDSAVHIDELLRSVEEDFTPSEVIANLFELEMRGLVRQMPGKNFVRVW